MIWEATPVALTKTIKIIPNKQIVGINPTVDKLHIEMGSHYILDESNEVVSKVDVTEGLTIDLDESDTPPLVDMAPLMTAKKQTIMIKGDSAYFRADGSIIDDPDDDRLAFGAYINNLIVPSAHEILHFDIVLPSRDDEPDVYNESLLDVEFFYNYEFFDYETLSQETVIRLLPSHLAWDYAKYAETNNVNLPTKDMIQNYGGTIPYTPSSMGHVLMDVADNVNENKYLFEISATETEGEFGEEPKTFDDNYFHHWTKYMRDPENNGSLLDFQGKNTHVFCFYEYGSSANKDYLPYYLSINIPTGDAVTQNLEQFHEGINNTRMSKFLFAYMARTVPEILPARVGEQAEEEKFLSMWDVESWWQQSNLDQVEELQNELFLTSEEDEYLFRH